MTEFFVVGLLGVALYGVWRGITLMWNKEEPKSEPANVEEGSKRKASTDCVPSILDQIQCTAETKNVDEGGQVDYTYQYQGQYFVLNTLPSSTKARLNYYNIMNTPETDETLLLDLCNRFNWVEIPKVVFTHDTETKTLDVHFILDIDIDDTDSFNKDNIKAIMHNMFRCRNMFSQTYLQAKQDWEKKQRTHIAGFGGEVK